VATAVENAEHDIAGCKAALDDIEERAEENGWAITPDWRIDVGDTGIGRDPIEFAAQQQMVQADLDQLKVRAHATDQELATAIRATVGEVQLDAGGQPANGRPQVPAPALPDDPNQFTQAWNALSAAQKEAAQQAMYNAAMQANPNLNRGDVSVTAWLGYDRPMSVLGQAPWPSYAEHGAGALDSFEDGMRASHVGGPSIDTVVGHSYGTTLVGAAVHPPPRAQPFWEVHR
jgi:hypothetical protein